MKKGNCDYLVWRRNDFGEMEWEDHSFEALGRVFGERMSKAPNGSRGPISVYLNNTKVDFLMT